MNMLEPTSLSKLSKKGADLHDAALRGGTSPRREASSGMNRRSSSHFRDLPANVIQENADSSDDEDDDEEEKKVEGIKISRVASGSDSDPGASK